MRRDLSGYRGETGIRKDAFQKLILGRQKSILVGTWIIYVLLACMAIFLHRVEIKEPDDAYYFLQIARNIADGKGFLELCNHAYRCPLFPGFLSLLMMSGINSIIAIKIVTVFLFSTSIFLIYALCRDLFGRFAGLIGAFLTAVSPWLILAPNMLLSENLFIPLFLLFLFAVARAFRYRTYISFALAGIVSGAGTLCRETMIFAPLLLLVALLAGPGRRRALKVVALFTLCHVLIIAPWTIRNYSIFHHFIPVSTNPWINVYIGNNPRYENTYSFKWVIPEGTRWNVAMQPDGADEYDVVVRSRREAIEYIRKEPGAFASRFFRKAWRFITPHFDLIRILGTNRILMFAIALELGFYTVFLLLYLTYCVRRLFPLSKAEPFLLLSLLFVLHIIFVAGITYTNSRYRLPAALIFMIHTTYYGDLLLARLAGMRRPLRLARARMLNTEVSPGDLVETWKLQARILLECFDRSQAMRNHMEHSDDQFPFVSYRTKELQ